MIYLSNFDFAVGRTWYLDKNVTKFWNLSQILSGQEPRQRTERMIERLSENEKGV